ncbi:magnesium chelatase [Longispora fulva]|uniref:Mg-protoporphyrin IX chelatase n=1 Tax=Longispora fulva TaxID=619741 RepID=A0A8J7GJR8_9ACTN|nr:magnesium chelatase subunit D family protein [Longispora fulva]MBG6137873.1 magnesium chelatase subunit D [Longispora fulva]GIG60127.1 magnesium chelatase [Longispora fulva]
MSQLFAGVDTRGEDSPVVPFPFSAVVGMPDLRLALLLNAVSPAIGGVLVRGEKGTAKSTMVRALARLLPTLDVLDGCRFSCAPGAEYPNCPDGPHDAVTVRKDARLVELPVGATEDRLLGSIDLEKALGAGTVSYTPGLLAAAHRGALYVDEVNLLPDHLVDALLDAAAMGEAHVERDGVSLRHAARFLLVGTMNPEEGELRPQLLDRFGLTVEVRAPRVATERVEVVRRRLAYEAAPEAFALSWAGADSALAERIATARTHLAKVELPDAELLRIAQVCAAFDVDGLRADLVVARTAIALAAWEGRVEVTAADVEVAARLALPHRRRRDPFDAPGLDEDTLQDALQDPPAPERPEDDPDGNGPDDDPDNRPDDDPDGRGPDDGPGDGPQDGGPDGGGAPESDQDRSATPPRPHAPDPDRTPPGDPAAPPRAPRSEADGDGTGRSGEDRHGKGKPFRARLLTVPGTGQGAAGRRSPAFTRSGRVVGARQPDPSLTGVHLVATVRAAAQRGSATLQRQDLRAPVRKGREANLVLFVVDASGSMAARRRLGAVTDAVLSLLMDAYQRRDKVGMITFRGSEAQLVLPPTSSVEVAAARLRDLGTGGRTPLDAGLRRAEDTLRIERLKDPSRRPLLVIVTDGRTTSGPTPAATAARLAAAGVASVVVDCESGHVRLGLAGQLAAQLGGEHVPLADVSVQSLRTVAGRAA